MKQEVKKIHLQHQSEWLWLEDAYQDLMSRLTPDSGMSFKEGQKPELEQINYLTQKLDRIEDQLSKAIKREELAELLEILFNAFTSRNASNIQAVASAYIFALSDFSRYIIEKTLQDFLKGLVPEQNLTYVPSPALFATHCRAVEKSQKIKINLMRKKLTFC